MQKVWAKNQHFKIVLAKLQLISLYISLSVELTYIPNVSIYSVSLSHFGIIYAHSFKMKHSWLLPSYLYCQESWNKDIPRSFLVTPI